MLTRSVIGVKEIDASHETVPRSRESVARTKSSLSRSVHDPEQAVIATEGSQRSTSCSGVYQRATAITGILPY